MHDFINLMAATGNNQFYVVLNNLKATKNSNCFETYVLHSLNNLKIIAEAENLEVAVVCCIFPNTIYNVPADLSFSYFLPPQFLEKKVTIPSGYYSDISLIIPTIEKQLDGKAGVKFAFNQLTNRFSLSCEGGTRCTISEEVGHLFGLKSGSSLKGKIAAIANPKILNYYSSGVKLLADFITTSSIENGKRESVLAVLPLSSETFGKSIFYEPKHLQYFSCISSQLNVFRFSFVYLDGTPVTTIDQISCLILHFKSNNQETKKL